MKRLFLIVLAVLLLAGTGIASHAEPQTGEKSTVRAACVYHTGSGKFVSEENADEKLNVAGLSRLPALVTIAEAVESGKIDLLNTTVTVSEKAAREKGPTAFIEANEIIKAELLFKSAAMMGAGDAVFALGEMLSGSEDAFLKCVNSLLESMGIDTVLSSISGEGSAFSARELACLSARLAKCKTYLKYSSLYMDSITHENGKETELVNSNRLVRTLNGCIGLSTGSSNDALYCGTFYTERTECGYICVILGAKNSAMRFEKAKEATETAFSTYKEIKIAKKGDVIIYDYPIAGAQKKMCEITAAADMSVLSANAGEKPKCTYNMPEMLTAPVKCGDVVGNAVYTDADGNILCTLELTVNTDINKAGFYDFFKAVLCMWLSAN